MNGLRLLIGEWFILMAIRIMPRRHPDTIEVCGLLGPLFDERAKRLRRQMARS